MRTARAAPLRLSGRGTHGLLQLHRRLLQSHPAALSSGVSLAHLLRTGDANRPTVRHPLNRPPKRGNFKVRDAVADYLDWFRATGKKSIKETEASIDAFILPRLGEVEVAALTAPQLRKWHMDIATAAPRLRTRPGERQKVRDTSDD